MASRTAWPATRPATQGADPNKFVAITDKLSAAALPAGEQFVTVRSAGYGEVLRGVSFTPGTSTRHSLGS